MITFTKEQLIASAHARIEFAEMMLSGELEPLKERTWSIELELARIALASLEAEPVMYAMSGEYLDADATSTSKAVVDAWVEEWDQVGEPGYRTVPLYAAPAAPVSVPDEVTTEDCPAFVKYDVTDIDEAWARGFNQCRAAMLQGAENAESLHAVKVAPLLNSSAKVIELQHADFQAKATGNSPVIPDCSCRTCRPVTFSDSRFVVCPECGNKRCPNANDHRNACTGSNEPGQEGSAYPAVPKQEVK